MIYMAEHNDIKCLECNQSCYTTKEESVLCKCCQEGQDFMNDMASEEYYREQSVKSMIGII